MKKIILQLALIFFVSSLAIFLAGDFVSSQNSSDAIAIRVMPNPNHYTIERWYQEQGFQGSPQSLIVDGYQAIRDGRTVYVNAANVNTVTNQMYTNIYLISYNQESENATVDILGQIVSHWKFNHNIINTGKCSISTIYCEEDDDCSGDYVCGNDVNDWQEGKCVIEDNSSDLSNTKTCLTDQDCPNNLYCTSSKAQVIRDVRRLGQLTDVDYLLDLYNSQNNKYPTLNSGTYIPQMTISTWPSWQEEFSKEIKLASNVIDPVNTLGYCGGDFAPDTCWNADTQSFYDSNLQDGVSLPSNSLIYVYTTDVNGTDYDICANMESGYDVAEGSVSNYDCDFNIGYFGNINNETPVLIDYNLEGSSYEEFSGMIRVEDPEGNPMTWSLNTSSSSWSSWSSVPQLQETNNPNQKRVFSQIAGGSGVYPIEIRVSDNDGNVLREDLDIVISDIGPQIQAEDINYVLDESEGLDYKASIFGSNLPSSVGSLNSNLSVNFDGSNSRTFSTSQTNLGYGLSKNITKIADNRYELNITGVLSNVGVDEINFNLEVTDKIGLSSNEDFKFDVIFDKPYLSLNCKDTVRIKQNYGCQTVADNSTDGIDFSYRGLPSGLIGNNFGQIYGRANEGGVFDIYITTTNEYGGSDTESFTLNVNTYCSDGNIQDPNDELTGGPAGNGVEECDVNAGIATTAGASSIDKKYSCTTDTLNQHDTSVRSGTCTFTGGYCGDTIVQETVGDLENLEECDYGQDIEGCCVGCQWEYAYKQFNLTFYDGSVEGSDEVTLTQDDTAYVNMPEDIRNYQSNSGLVDAELIATETESTAVVYVTDTSVSMHVGGVSDVIEALVGTGIDGGGALGDLYNHDSEISVGLVELTSNITSDYIRDISVQSNYEDLVSKIQAYSSGGGTPTERALDEAYRMLSGFNADNKIVVLLSDGKPNSDPTSKANEIKADGIEIYTITYRNTGIHSAMCYWSSDDNVTVCDGNEDPFYSYVSSNASEVFDSITAEITSAPENNLVVSINNQSNDEFSIADDSIMTDLNVNFEGITCDPATAVCSPDKVPIEVNFDGEGEVRLYNLRLGVAEKCGN